MFPKSVSWLGIEKLNLTQQKHAFTNHKKCTTTQNTQKTKARFSRLLRHPAWKWRGPILISALHKFVTYLLRHLPTCLQPRNPDGVYGREPSIVSDTGFYRLNVLPITQPTQSKHWRKVVVVRLGTTCSQRLLNALAQFYYMLIGLLFVQDPVQIITHTNSMISHKKVPGHPNCTDLFSLVTF